MKNKRIIIGIIIGLILITGITSYAAYQYQANNVSYMKSNGTEVTVAQALNELYVSKKINTANSSANNYSTDEQVIGTWIDGKNIYQKTVTGLNITLGWNDKYFAYNGNVQPLVENVDKIISGIGYGGNFSMPVTVSTGTNWGIRGVDVWTINAITIQYTKTTDTVTE